MTGLEGHVFIVIFRKERVDLCECRIDIKITIQHGSRIGRMIELRMCRKELFVGKIRDLLRISA